MALGDKKYVATQSDVTAAVSDKVEDAQVLVNVPSGAVFTDTVTAVDNNLTSTSTVNALSANMGKTLEDVKIDSDATETGASQILNIVKISQADYDLLTPVSTTFYVIVG